MEPGGRLVHDARARMDSTRNHADREPTEKELLPGSKHVDAKSHLELVLLEAQPLSERSKNRHDVELMKRKVEVYLRVRIFVSRIVVERLKFNLLSRFECFKDRENEIQEKGNRMRKERVLHSPHRRSRNLVASHVLRKEQGVGARGGWQWPRLWLASWHRRRPEVV